MLHQQLRRRLRARRAQARDGRRRRAHLRRAQVLDAAVARSDAPREPRAHAPPTSPARCRSRTSRSPPGRWASRRRRTGQAYQISVRARGTAHRARRVRATSSSDRADGTLVRLRDVGRAELGAERLRRAPPLQRRDGRRHRRLPAPDANALEVGRRVLARSPQRLSKVSTRAEVPDRLRYDAGRARLDPRGARHARRSDRARRPRDLPLPRHASGARSSPRSRSRSRSIGTFAFVKLLGFSINTLTLFGITLATGLVVDDAIVVIENIERFIAREAD